MPSTCPPESRARYDGSESLTQRGRVLSGESLLVGAVSGPNLRITGFSTKFLLGSILLFCCSPVLVYSADASISLSEMEKEWLSAHDTIWFAPDPNFPPIEWVDSAEAFCGVAADYIKLAQTKLGVTFSMVRCTTWQQVLDRAEKGTIDVLSAAAQSKERSEYLLFSKPHIVFPAVIICSQNVSKELTLDDLRGMKVAVVRGYVWEEFLRRDYPEIQLELVANVHTGLRKVSFGLADAFLENLATTTYYLKQEGITNLHVAGETGYRSKLSFAVRKDLPELHGILNKVVASISPDERESIRRSWIPALPGQPSVSRTLFLALAVSTAVTLFILTAILAWNRSLQSQVDQRTRELRNELSERKTVEESLRQSEHKYRELVENANSMILRIDARGRITFFNEFAQRFFGYTNEEAVGKHVVGLIVPEFESQTGRDLSNLISRVAESPTEFTYNENENVKKNGDRVWVAWNNRPLFDSAGNLLEVLCIGSDMTERMKARERERHHQAKLAQADRLATLGTLVSGIAHEINNPTNYISLNNENLKDIWQGIKEVLDTHDNDSCQLNIAGLPYRDIRTETDRLITAISGGTDRIKAIVKGLKEFAGSGPMFEDRKVDLNAVVNAALLITNTTIKKATDCFFCDLSSEPVEFRGSFQAIEQVLVNLIANACQALTDRTSQLTIRTESDRENKIGRLIVQDTGKGIAPETLKRIFDPFFTTRRNNGGTGLGLSVSYSIVKDHGGVIAVNSEEGEGTMVTVSLPHYAESAPA